MQVVDSEGKITKIYVHLFLIFKVRYTIEKAQFKASTIIIVKFEMKTFVRRKEK